MAKSSKPKEPTRAFSIRMTLSMYEKIAELAHADQVDMNPKVNQLLRLGLGEHINLDAAVARLIRKEAFKE